MKTTKELLGARIRELRKIRGLSQERLAEMVNIEPRQISRIEGGKSYPSLDRLERFSQVLNVPLKTFFEFGHLDDSGVRDGKITEIMKELGEDYKQIIYRIVKSFDKTYS